MAVTDSIADMLTRIRNANNTNKESVDIPASKLKVEIARVMKEEGYIKHYKVIKDNKQGILKIYLKYGSKGEKVISNLKRVSKPGCRVYVGKGEVPRVLSGFGISIISTSQGVMTGKKSKEMNVGGEVLCNIW